MLQSWVQLYAVVKRSCWLNSLTTDIRGSGRLAGCIAAAQFLTHNSLLRFPHCLLLQFSVVGPAFFPTSCLLHCVLPLCLFPSILRLITLPSDCIACDPVCSLVCCLQPGIKLHTALLAVLIVFRGRPLVLPPQHVL